MNGTLHICVSFLYDVQGEEEDRSINQVVQQVQSPCE